MTKVPAIEATYGSDRREWNLLIRRPFYLNLRLGFTQNALWIGTASGRTKTVINWFASPWSAYSVTFGRTSRATILAEIRRINEAHNPVPITPTTP